MNGFLVEVDYHLSLAIDSSGSSGSVHFHATNYILCTINLLAMLLERSVVTVHIRLKC
jgi:hypothetical protein